MTSPRIQSISALVLRELQRRKGSMKVTAALGELLAADAMMNLCSAVGFWNTSEYSDEFRRKVNNVDMRVHVEVNEAFAVFEATDDAKLASERLIPVLRAGAHAIRELLTDVDFYDDAVVDPYGGVL